MFRLLGITTRGLRTSSDRVDSTFRVHRAVFTVNGKSDKVLSIPNHLQDGLLIPLRHSSTHTKRQPNTRFTQSYVHTLGKHPLQGKTIGALLDETVNKYPGREAAVFCKDGTRLSFSQLKEQVDSLAAGLVALGIQRGDRVGIWSPNNLQWVITQFATARIGAILVNINPAYRTEEAQYALHKVSCKAIIAARQYRTQNYYEMLSEICPELESTATPGRIKSKTLPHLQSIVMIGTESLAGVLNFNDLLELGNASHREQIQDLQKSLQFDDPINIQFTSGTTGTPKGATLTHHNLVNCCYFVGEVLGYMDKYHRVCIPLPLYHCFGMVLGSLSLAVHGCTGIFPGDTVEPESTLRAIHSERATSVYGTPTMFIDMLYHPNFDAYDLSSLRTGIMGGSPCPIEIMKQVSERMHMKEVTITYGLTEMSSVIFQSNRTDPIEKRVSTVGHPGAHVEVKVVDQTTKEIVPVNTVGEICSRGYLTMLGYWDDKKKTKQTIDKEGWFHTGDLGFIDEEGYGHVVGRDKDMIIRGGENIYPAEVEQFLYRHPKIEDVQVIGVPDDRLGEIVCAWVKMKAGEIASQDDIVSFCKDKIAYNKIPTIVKFVSEFPLTVTGKVQKYQMRAEMVKFMQKQPREKVKEFM